MTKALAGSCAPHGVEREHSTKDKWMQRTGSSSAQEQPATKKDAQLKTKAIASAAPCCRG
eukprot:233877-Pelagomonas_calceolata.AAC.6